MRNAISNALANAFRKKGRSFIELWHRIEREESRAQAEDDIKLVQAIEAEAEKKTGASWVDILYQNAGIKKPKQKAPQPQVSPSV